MDEDWGDSDQGEEDVETLEHETTDLLIAIATEENMFECDYNGKSTFKNALQSVYQIMDDMLLRSGRGQRNHVAVVAVTEDSAKFIICDFKDYLPETLKKFKNLCDMEDQELKKMYMRSSSVNIADFLIQCKKMLSVCGGQTVKYIAYITNTDNPIMNDEDQKFHAVNQAKTLNELNIYLELLTFNSDFDYGVFFQELLLAAKSKFYYEYLTTVNSLKEKLLSLVRFKGRKIRFHPFQADNTDVSDEKYFEVIEKLYVQKHKLLNNIKVTKDSNREVKRQRTGVTLLNTYKFNYSKEQDAIQFSALEKDALLHSNIPPGFTLLSVSPKLLQPGMHSSDPRFIQSNKKQNLPYFDHFWHYCIDKNRVLLCARKYTINGPVKYVELSPKLINNVRSFLVLSIPFKGDIRGQELEEGIHVTKKKLEAAEEFVKAASLKYDPLMFHNPAYCKKREYVRSQLLEEPPKEMNDFIDVKVKNENISEVVQKFKNVCFVEEMVESKKRKNVASGSRAKKLK